MTALAPAAGIELLDDPGADAHRVAASLANIARANRWFGGAAAVRRGLARALAGVPAGSTVTFLDVGTGAGDLPRVAAAWARPRGLRVRSVGIERHPAAARLATRSGLPVTLADAGTLPLADRSVDLVLLSQVAHHFAPDAIVRLLAECARVARIALIVADLRSSKLAALGWPVVGRLMGFDHDTIHDGVVSLERGFSAASLAALLDRAGLPARVERRPGARLVAVWHCPA